MQANFYFERMEICEVNRARKIDLRTLGVVVMVRKKRERNMLVRQILLAVFAIAGSQLTAHAELTSAALSNYNTAVNNNDDTEIVRTARILVDEAISDPQNPNATIAAYEASLKLCERGHCDDASDGADFVVGQPDTASHPVMRDRQLLKAYVDFKVKSNGSSRSSLKDALEPVKTANPSVLSLRAFIQLANEYYSRADWGDAFRTSSNAVEHLATVKSSVPDAYFIARETAATSYLLHQRGPDAQEDLIRLNAELEQLRSRYEAEGVDIPDWLERTYWRSEAWVGVAQALFWSNDTRGSLSEYRAGKSNNRPLSEKQIDEIRAEYPLAESDEPSSEAEDGQLPFCEGELKQTKAIRYPSSAAFNGMVGSVILRLKFDEKGNVTEPEVLAAVPIAGFEEELIESVSEWRWQKSDDEDKACRLNRENVIMPVTFSIR
ncbi:MAG: hypothetical protein CMK07_08420 [Ponticaulis sp.]|nr:hypothetical protein [Ponticaulis sp.]